MGLFSKLFGSEKIVDSAVAGIDKAFHTEEEKWDARQKFLKLYEPFKLAQRYIAMTFCPAYVFSWLLTIVTELVCSFLSLSLDLSKVYALLEGKMASMVIVILCFYFGGGAVEGVVRKLTKSNKSKT